MAKTTSHLLRQRPMGIAVAAVTAACAWGTPAAAKPIAPQTFCDAYPEAPACYGQDVDCRTCHSLAEAPPALNAYGKDVKDALTSYIPAPFDDAGFQQNLASALLDIESDDSDGDGSTNLDELIFGSNPGDPTSAVGEAVCPTPMQFRAFETYATFCTYDAVYAYRKVSLDFCGIGPTYDELSSFREMALSSQLDALHDKLDSCLDTEFWKGPNGRLWELANRKIRPVGGLIGFADFFDDYNLFTYTQIDDNDARDVLLAQYLVERIDTPTEDGGSISTYSPVDTLESQVMQQERRAGLLTLGWPLFYNTMFTALPRGTAAAAYRSFLNLDIAQSEGLDWPVAGEPVDYDEAGVTDPACATCHSVLDPLSYPFSTYNGLQGDGQLGPLMYDPNRIDKYFVGQYPLMSSMGESGYLFGQPVSDLLEWAEVAANSDQFFRATVEDYWKLLLSEAPSADAPDDYADYNSLWEGLRDDPNHSVEAMLHHFIETEAYGAP